MEYHNDRFVDHSLMFFEGNRLLAVLPASIKKNQLYSHAGLTFGGLLYTAKLGVCDVMDIFDCLISYLQKNHFKGLTYKLIPSIFHKLPTEEDLFALYKVGARVVKRELSTAVSFENQIKFSKGKREGVKKAIKHNVFRCFQIAKASQASQTSQASEARQAGQASKPPSLQASWHRFSRLPGLEQR